MNSQVANSPDRLESPLANSNIKTGHTSTCSLSHCHGGLNDISTPRSLSIALSTQTPPNALYSDVVEERPARTESKRRIQLHDDAFQGSVLSMQRALPSPATSSTPNLFSIFPMDPTHNYVTPTQVSLNMKPRPVKQWSNNIEQLIRETDEAFMAVKFTLTEVKHITRDRNSKGDSEPSAQAMTKLIARKQDRKAFMRHAPASRIERKESNKSRAKHIRTKKMALHTFPMLTTPSSKWSFAEVTDSMSGLFGRSIFGRLEVDEMLGDARINTNSGEHNTKSKQFIEVVPSALTDEMPALFEGPYNLGDVSSRLKDTHISSDFHALSFVGEPSGSHQSLERSTLDVDIKSAYRPPPLESPVISHNKARFDNVASPESPDDSQHVHSITRFSHLQAIPEAVSAVSPSKPNFRNNSLLTDTVCLHNQMEFMCEGKSEVALAHPSAQRLIHQRIYKEPETRTPRILQSSLYSMNSPLFRHGSIRINKSRISENLLFGHPGSGTHTNVGTPHRNARDKQSAALDWTAFQMAISGGTGDFLMGGDGGVPSVAAMQELEREVDDILVWWDGFGFSHKDRGYGNVVCEKPRKKKSTDKRYRDGTSMVAMSYTAELPAAMSNVRLQKSKIDGSAGSHIAQPKDELESVYDNEYSLPDSSMDEISQDAIDRRGSTVVMGFNLGYDLPDYLKWEAGHTERLADT